MTLSESEIRDILNRALQVGASWEAEAILGGGQSTVLRFANNRFHQNTRENRLQLSLRVVKGKRAGVVTGDRFDAESLRALGARARAAAETAEEIADLPPLLGPQVYQPSPGRHSPEALRDDWDDKAELFRDYFARCEAEGFEAAGKLEKVNGTIGDYGEISPLAMANTSGLFAYSPGSWLDFSTTVARGGETGWSGNAGRRWDQVALSDLCTRALEKARRNREQREIPPGRYPVLLEPAAVRTLLAYLVEAFNAQAVEEGRSYLEKRLGERLFPDWFSLRDDAYHPAIGGSPFDGEGVPVKPVTLVERGRVLGWVNTRQIAARMDESPTGHGAPLPNPVGALPRNVIFSGGNKSLEELIASTERAILVTRLWYTTPVDEKQLVISGMTRDGTFLVQDGRIVAAVKNLRFNQSVPELLASVREAGAVVPCFGWLVPPLAVDAFHFSSTTRF